MISGRHETSIEVDVANQADGRRVTLNVLMSAHDPFRGEAEDATNDALYDALNRWSSLHEDVFIGDLPAIAYDALTNRLLPLAIVVEAVTCTIQNDAVGRTYRFVPQEEIYH